MGIVLRSHRDTGRFTTHLILLNDPLRRGYTELEAHDEDRKAGIHQERELSDALGFLDFDLVIRLIRVHIKVLGKVDLAVLVFRFRDLGGRGQDALAHGELGFEEPPEAHRGLKTVFLALFQRFILGSAAFLSRGYTFR